MRKNIVVISNTEAWGDRRWPGPRATRCLLAQYLNREVGDQEAEFKKLGITPSDRLLYAMYRMNNDEGKEKDVRFLRSLAKSLGTDLEVHEMSIDVF